MKATGIPWIPEVDERWETYKVAHGFSSIGSGTTPDTETAGYYDGDVLWVTTGELRETVITDTTKKVTRRALLEYSALRLFPQGTLLIAMYGATIGRLGFLGKSACMNQACCALNGGTFLDARFVYYWLLGFRQDVIQLASGGGQPNISQEKIRSLRIPAPLRDAQLSIATSLERKTAAIGALIAKKERLLELLQEKRQALITQAVTKGLDPKVPMKESGVEWIGETPAHWDVARVKHVARLESGHTPSRAVPEHWLDSNDIPWVSLNDTKVLAKNDYISDTAVYVNSLGLQNSSAHMLPANIVVFTRDATIGKAAITTRPMAVSQHIIAWVCGRQIDPEYLLRVFYGMETFLDRFTFGATIKTIGMGDVGRLVTPVPPRDEQAGIVDFVRRKAEEVDTLVGKLTAQLALFREYRQALITAAVTGKIDLSKEVA